MAPSWCLYKFIVVIERDFMSFKVSKHILMSPQDSMAIILSECSDIWLMFTFDQFMYLIYIHRVYKYERYNLV